MKDNSETFGLPSPKEVREVANFHMGIFAGLCGFVVAAGLGCRLIDRILGAEDLQE